MARQVLVLAIVLFAIFSYAYAETANAPVADGDEDPATNSIPSMGPSSDDHIGTDDGDSSDGAATAAAANGPSSDDVVEGPVGGPDFTGLDALAPGASESSASSLHLSAFAGVLAVAAAGYFF